MKIKTSSIKRVLTVICQKALLSIAEFILLISVAGYVATFIEKTNRLMTWSVIVIGLFAVIVLRSLQQLWQDKGKLFKTPIFERWGKQFCLN